MVQAMERRAKDKYSKPIIGRVINITLPVCLFLCLLLCCASIGVAHGRDKLLEESGIRYPDGYDINTVGEVNGKVLGFSQPDQGPARFNLLTKKETYTVITSPKWYWNDLDGKVRDGDDVTVIGSKTLGKDGNLYIIAQEIKILSSGKFLVFRGKDGGPLWRGPGGGSGGGSRGFGGPASGKGGLGGGIGGAGRGRQ
jgi:hypothetical protein